MSFASGVEFSETVFNHRTSMQPLNLIFHRIFYLVQQRMMRTSSADLGRFVFRAFVQHHLRETLTIAPALVSSSPA
eukprot:5444325-Pyramimonas_sp.AAC.1